MSKNILLCGNPNVGKSSLYNILTKSHEHTGNWTGKTVEITSKAIKNTDYKLIDLPGIYSLSSLSDEEIVARNTMYFTEYEKIIYVCDASNLEKNLNLLLQISEINKNIILCLNMVDELKSKQINIDVDLLKKILGIEVIECSTKSNIGIDTLLLSLDKHSYLNYNIIYNDEIEKHISNIINYLDEPYKNRFIAIKILERDLNIIEAIQKINGDNIINENIKKYIMSINSEEIADNISIIINNFSKDICNKIVKKNKKKDVNKLDKILTSKIYAVPLMLLMLFMIFLITIVLANYPSELLSNLFIYIEKLLFKLSNILNIPKLVYEPIIFGVYRVVSFIISVMFPPLVIFFFLFTYAEESGLLPRIAFNFDKICSKANCHGKQSLTICSGFGCNACAVVGSRIIDSKRDKLLAILTNSFIPCNGRFPMIIAIISMFFVNSNNKIMIALYLTMFVIFAIFMSFLTSFILSKTILKGYSGFFVLELPDYKKVKIRSVIKTSFVYKSLSILKKAVLISLPAGLIIYILTKVNINNVSLLVYISCFLDSFAKLLGLDGTILTSFILGFPANEIVMPLMIMGYLNETSVSLISNYLTIKNILIDNNWTIVTAMCTILFSIMHFPCATTLATIKSEVGTKWMIYSFIIPLLTGIVFLLLLNIFI